MSLKRNCKVERVSPVAATNIKNLPRYRVRSIPAAGSRLNEEDSEQINLL
jgi:DNA gyrase subunit A